MENHKIKLRQAQRDFLLQKVMSESPVEEDKIRSFLTLKKKLSAAKLYSDEEELDKYVELNSIVAIKTSFGFKYGLQVVMPEDSDIQSNKLSVLSSLGCAVFGNKEGDKVKWYFEGEPEYAVIVKVVKSDGQVSGPFNLG